MAHLSPSYTYTVGPKGTVLAGNSQTKHFISCMAEAQPINSLGFVCSGKLVFSFLLCMCVCYCVCVCGGGDGCLEMNTCHGVCVKVRGHLGGPCSCFHLHMGSEEQTHLGHGACTSALPTGESHSSVLDFP